MISALGQVELGSLSVVITDSKKPPFSTRTIDEGQEVSGENNDLHTDGTAAAPEGV